MATSYEKERLKKTTILYVVVMVLIVVLILLAVQDTQVKTIASILVLLVGAAAIIVQWLLLGKKPASANEQESKKPVQTISVTVNTKQDTKEPEHAVSTRTGAPCVTAGVYHCAEHIDKTVTMVEGKRFPPCRGDNRGHSATWILES
ncbi:MAG: hypothetical protein ACQ5SW_00135 [Sphaerochaetaceae bacterium]